MRRTGIVVAVLVSVSALGAEERIETTVERTLATEDGSLGGCMAWLSQKPYDLGLACHQGNNWVTFDCAGKYVSKAAAQRLFDTAQVAQLTGRDVRVIVDDSRKHGHFCLASRVDLLDAAE